MFSVAVRSLWLPQLCYKEIFRNIQALTPLKNPLIAFGAGNSFGLLMSCPLQTFLSPREQWLKGPPYLAISLPLFSLTPSLTSLWCLCFTPVTACSCFNSKCGLFYYVLDQQRGIPFLLKPSGHDSNTRNVCLQITLVLGDNDRWPFTILGEVLMKVIDPIFEWLSHPGRQVKWKICQCLQNLCFFRDIRSCAGLPKI